MQKKRITSLVVDDSLEQAECFARLLEAIGHRASFVIHPLDALDAVEAMHPDIVFVDIDMPEMDGWALAGMLRQRFGEGSIRLIAVSGSESRSANCDARVFDAYLVKPVTLEALNDVFSLSL